jgi:hypothetical protein
VFVVTSGGAVNKAMKVVAATVGGLMVFGMILEYYGIITINWEKISSKISEGMGSIANSTMVMVNTTSHHIAAHGIPTHIQVAGLEVPLGATVGFGPGLCFLGAHVSNASFSIMDTWIRDLEDGSSGDLFNDT